jgi:hypothetical protein
VTWFRLSTGLLPEPPEPPLGEQGWEARMTRRAADRADAALPDERYVDRREREEAEEVRRAIASLNLDDAVHILAKSVPCGCSGGPGCCVNWSRQAHRLQRAAHIVARQLSDLIEKED